MFNFWFSEFVIPIVVTCPSPPSPQTTDIDDLKLGRTFWKRNEPRKLQPKLNLSIVCLRFPVVFTQMFCLLSSACLSRLLHWLYRFEWKHEKKRKTLESILVLKQLGTTARSEIHRYSRYFSLLHFG